MSKWSPENWIVLAVVVGYFTALSIVIIADALAG